VPSLTILVQNLSSTVFASVNRGTFTLAEWTILPKKGVFKAFLDGHPRLRDWLVQVAERKQAKKRIDEGFQVQDPDENETAVRDKVNDDASSSSRTGAGAKPNAGAEERRAPENNVTPNQGGKEEEVTVQTELETPHDLARQLSVAIKHAAQDLRADPPKRYSYEQWVHFTKLIRFSSARGNQNGPLAAVLAVARREEEEGLVEWDWIGEESPMLADISESEWVLDRLCESLDRYMKVISAGVVSFLRPSLVFFFPLSFRHDRNLAA
jgi:potassium channel subfamily K